MNVDLKIILNLPETTCTYDAINMLYYLLPILSMLTLSSNYSTNHTKLNILWVYPYQFFCLHYTIVNTSCYHRYCYVGVNFYNDVLFRNDLSTYIRMYVLLPS